MKAKILYALLILVVVSCKSTGQQSDQSSLMKGDMPNRQDTAFVSSSGEIIERIIKDDTEWKNELTEMEYYVLRQKGTERAFTGDLLENKNDGIYTCAACGLPLFDSKTKFKSGSGWPSFYQPYQESFILEDTDYKIGYARTEVMCRRCGGHLGHVFSDGPDPTGLRYCINSVSLDFVDRDSVDQVIKVKMK